MFPRTLRMVLVGHLLSHLTLQPTNPIKRASCAETSLGFQYYSSINKVGQFAFDAGTNLSAQHAASLQTSINTLPLKLIQQHWAWVFSTEDDQRVISSLTKSSFAEVTFQTSNGIKATDMFSLRGFNEALTQAQVECGLLELLS